MAAQLGSRLMGVFLSVRIGVVVVFLLGVDCCLRGTTTDAWAKEDTVRAIPKAETSSGVKTDVKDKTKAEDTSDQSLMDPLGANAACYVCHMTYVKEELSKIHLKEKIGCIKCHGTSAGHANDENIGATKPDVTFQRKQVNTSCRECHSGHDAAPEVVIASWIDLGSPKKSPICTDCHGKHRIEKAAEK